MLLAFAVAVGVVGLVFLAVVIDGIRRGPSDEVDVGGPSSSTVAADVPAIAGRDPMGVVDEFLAAWAGGEWESIRELVVDPSAQAERALSDWWVDLGVTSVTFRTGAPQVADGTATVTLRPAVELGAAGVWSYVSEMRLVLLPEGWRVDWMPTTLHPALSAGDRLGVELDWPERGRITDREDRDLVASAPAIVVGLIPERVESREAVAAAFASALGLVDSVVDDTLDRPGVQPDWFLPVTTIAREQNIDLRPQLYPVPGVAFRLVESRGPLDSLALVPVVGTVGEITAEQLAELGPPYVVGTRVGQSGLEAAFERTLAGVPLARIVRRSTDGSVTVLDSLRGTPGEDVRTTLSLDVQRAAAAAVTQADLPASLVAIDVPSGEIRAVAQAPVGGHNRALSGLYPPGSTFKIIVATALLERGMEPGDRVTCPATVEVGGRVFRNAIPLPAGMTLQDAFARSCNTAFIQLGLELGHSVIADTARRYGFAVPVDIGVAAADASFPVPTDDVELAASLIGQGDVLTSPLSLAVVAATAAGGTLHPPTLVPRDDVAVLDDLDATVLADLQSMMRAVVTDGTGVEAAVEGISVAGKTGTAQIATADGATTVAWFVGFADDLAFAVAVEGGAAGGTAAAPVAAAFLEKLGGSAGGLAPDECVVAGADWVMFQGDATRTGCSLAPTIVEPRRLWQAEVGINAWLNSPIVVGDTVVLGSAGTRRAGPDGGDGVYALDLRTGDEKWFFPAANDVNGVAAHGGLVVATGDEGMVWGLDLADGEIVWSHEAAAPVLTNPLILDDLIVVGDASGVLRALDLEGRLRWSVGLEGAIRGGAASDGRVIYVVSEVGDTVALTTDGFELWRTRIEYGGDAWGRHEGARSLPIRVFGPPTIDRDRLVITFVVDGGPVGPAVLALDRYVGTAAWWGSDPAELRGGGNARSSVARHGDTLMLASSISGGAQVIDSATGEMLRKIDSGVGCTRQWASPVVVGELLVLARPDGAVYAHDVTTGDRLWRHVPSSGAEFPPATGCTAGGERVQDGFELQASVAVAPDGTLIVASMSQFVYAIGEA